MQSVSPSSAASRREIRFHMRWMIRRDMEPVLAIERDAFWRPWTECDFIRALRQRNCIGMVAECGTQRDSWSTLGGDARIMGFMIYESHKTSIHLLNFAVARDSRRCGVGSQMLAKLAEKLSARRRNRIELIVGEDNLAAHLFFRTNGYVAESIVRRPYPETEDDGYRFVFRVCGGK